MYSDKLEDHFNTPKLKNSLSNFFPKYAEIIAEEVNENLEAEAEKENLHKQNQKNHKILDSSLDKSEGIENVNDLHMFELEEHITETIEEDPEDDDKEINIKLSKNS